MVALLVPPFLTRALPTDKFGAWALVLQLSALVGYLEFGIQNAVGRYVAHANERSDFDHRDTIVNTGFAILSAACILAVLLIGVLIVLLPRFFRGMPPGLYPDVRTALALVGGSLAIGLPVSVLHGIFIGLQRYEIPAAIIAGSKVLGGVLLVIIARHGGSIPLLAFSAASVNLISYVLLWYTSRHYAPEIRFSPHFVSRSAGTELAGYCASLTVWGVGMLLVSGLDLTLVGVFDFKKVAFYSVAVSVVTFVAGVQNAVFSVMMPSAAVLHARGASRELGRLVLEGTRYGMLLLLLMGVPLLLATQSILQVWVGQEYASGAANLLRILLVANMIRLSFTPYAVALVGTGQQRRVVLIPIIEGLTNLSLSVVAGYYFGAIGIALGTLGGSLFLIWGVLSYNIPRTCMLDFGEREYVQDSLLKPIVCVSPLLCCWLIQNSMVGVAGSIRAFILMMGVIAAAWCVWRWSLARNDRERILILSRLRSLSRAVR